MRQQSAPCILIKDDDQEEECCSRLHYLRSQRFCERISRQCADCCQICEKHGDQRLKSEHTRIYMQDFVKKFIQLEATCSRQTQHFIEQMDRAEQKAIEEIAKKKQEYFKQIEEVKIHLMKKTYRTLDQKYTNLYEKYKNNRLDKVRCCEVFWVMSTNPSNHTIKHSEINKKLDQILRKFQSFKEISKNMPTENMFSNKQKAKKGKISQKLGAMAQMKKDPIALEKISYSTQIQDKYIKRMKQIQKKFIMEKGQLISEINHLRQKNTKYYKYIQQLEDQINNFRKKTSTKPSLKLRSRLLNINCIIHQSAEPEQMEEIGIPNSKKNQLSHIEQSTEKNPNNMNSQKRIDKNNIEDKNKQQNIFAEFQKRLERKQLISNNLLNQLQKQKVNDLKEHQNPMINEEEQSKQKSIVQENNKDPNDQMNAIIKNPQQQIEVKIQPSDSQPFVKWDNPQLLKQIKQFGTSNQTGLKVQQIERKLSFKYVRPTQNIVKINSSLLKKPQSLLNKQKHNTPESKKGVDVNKMAQKLFSKHQQTKKKPQGQTNQN